MEKEIIVMVGMLGAGKSSVVEEYSRNGYSVVSDDIYGINKSEKVLKIMIQDGKEKIIIDNTHYNKASRAEVIKIGHENGYKVNCLHLTTSFEDAQYNTVSRMIRRHGKLLRSPQEYKDIKDPNIFPVAAMYRARKAFESPTTEEGFDLVMPRKFIRVHNGYTGKAIILDYDGTLRETTGTENPWPEHPDHVKIMPGRTKRLKEYQDNGYYLLGVSNQSWSSEDPSYPAKADACFKRTNELLGLDIDYMFCSHAPAPITCYCRKPGCGLGVEFIEKYKLDPALCIMVGDRTTDKTFAKRCGFQYMDQADFFK